MENIPTAEEIFKKYFDKANRIQEMHFKEMMIEFAKLHVEAALEMASKEVKQFPVRINEMGYCEKLILNSYPLENIK